VGSSSAAVLHLLSHGAFKALLFLAAGSVAHAVGSTSMAEMGGLRRRLPVTFVTTTLGFGALAGVVPLVGFFTKDAVLGAVLAEAEGGRLVSGWLAWALLVSGLLTVVLTMAYTVRAWLLVFFGDPAPALAERVETPRESPPLMTVPLVLLAVPTVLGGAAVYVPERLLGEAAGAELVHLDMAVLTTVLVAVVLLGVVRRWRNAGRRDPWRPVEVPLVGLDRVYDAAVVRPVAHAALLVRQGDRDVVDAYAGGAGASARGLGWLLRRAQNGNVQAYLMVVVVGAVAVGVAAGALA
jgi:NADH-quinone oxidoreductase subunit L